MSRAPSVTRASTTRTGKPARSPRVRQGRDRRRARGRVRETTLAATDPRQRFRFRYQELRLLAESNGRMFLIPGDWEPSSGSVLVLPADAAVRVSFSPG
ncbi:hypothetical protein [Streptomyces hundungensis]|uniref:hypothetical protein n=1 Tax=Streptomyces hundungensis TaxID=1077946 RepID=UPI0013C4D32C|nr:hypothetical protein [Streptomyces hundungensis]